MNETSRHGETERPGCPDFELLSCFADGELASDAAASLDAHLQVCPRCAALSARLQVDFAAAGVRQGGSVRADCIAEESLVLYALGADGDGGAIAAHLAGCDGCVGALAAVRARLALAGEIDRAVPAAVQQRAHRVLEPALTELAPPPAAERRRAGLAFLANWKRALRVPVFVPAALAAGALLAVAVRGPLAPSVAPEGERARAIDAQSVAMRVTAVEAVVHDRPSRQSTVVATVRRGANLTVAGVERDWYQVQLEDGRPGWVEREAFE